MIYADMSESYVSDSIRCPVCAGPCRVHLHLEGATGRAVCIEQPTLDCYQVSESAEAIVDLCMGCRRTRVEIEEILCAACVRPPGPDPVPL